MINIFYSSIILFVMLFTQAKSQNIQYTQLSPESQVEFISNFQAKTQSLRQLECSFVQQKHISVLTNVAESKGRMCYKLPNNLRWEYFSPEPFAFILENDKARVENEKGPVEIPEQPLKMITSLTDMIISMVSGEIFSDNKNFSASFFASKNSTQITLIPKTVRMKRFFSKIVIYIDSETFLSTSIEMFEKSGDSTKIEFSNFLINS